MKRGESLLPDLPLDDVEASKAEGIFDMLRLPDVQGQPRMKEAAGQWFRDIVRAAFGGVERRINDEGLTDFIRRVGEVFILIPKKNSKTTNAAALGIVALMMNSRPNVDGVIIGPTQEVADKCFAQMQGMITADEYLSKRFRVVEHKKTIIDLHRDPDTLVSRNVRLKVKSFDKKVVVGSIPFIAIIDELHEMSNDRHAKHVIAQIRAG